MQMKSFWMGFSLCRVHCTNFLNYHVTYKMLPVYVANAVPGWYKRVSAGMGTTQKRIKTSYFLIHSSCKQVDHGVIDCHSVV